VLAGVAPLTISGATVPVGIIVILSLNSSMSATYSGTIFFLTSANNNGGGSINVDTAATYAFSMDLAATDGRADYLNQNSILRTTGDITISSGHFTQSATLACGTLRLGTPGSGKSVQVSWNASATVTCTNFTTADPGSGAALTFLSALQLAVKSNIDISWAIPHGYVDTFQLTTSNPATISGDLYTNYLYVYGAPKVITFASGTTVSVGGFYALGSAGNVITMQGLSGAPWSIDVRAAYIAFTADYLTLRDSQATTSGGISPTTLLAGSHSTDAGGNTGWIFAAALAGHNAQMMSADF
jgi:hypothetical protein